MNNYTQIARIPAIAGKLASLCRLNGGKIRVRFLNVTVDSLQLSDFKEVASLVCRLTDGLKSQSSFCRCLLISKVLLSFSKDV